MKIQARVLLLLGLLGASCAVSTAAVPVKVLVIGDSLSVSAFGPALEAGLRRLYGDKSVALVASCGSSPEDWLSDTPVFVTNCGYRLSTPTTSVLYDFKDGRKPRPVKTHKLPKILAACPPDRVIVQLGTNWMDALARSGNWDESAHRRIIADFIGELRRSPGGKPDIIWVLPPSSAKYPASVHRAVEKWITDASRDLRFKTINSRSITGSYRMGTTGSDGVHYSDEAGRRWANGVLRELVRLDRAFPLAPARGGH